MTGRMWQKRPRNAKFASPEDLWLAAVEYFEWTEENPIIKNSPMGDTIKPRAMTITGFCRHAGVSQSAYEATRKLAGFDETCEHIQAVMYDQKFTEAAADNMNANIISRDLNLAEKQEISGPNGGAIEGGFTFVGVGADDDG